MGGLRTTSNRAQLFFPAPHPEGCSLSCGEGFVLELHRRLHAGSASRAPCEAAPRYSTSCLDLHRTVRPGGHVRWHRYVGPEARRAPRALQLHLRTARNVDEECSVFLCLARTTNRRAKARARVAVLAFSRCGVAVDAGAPDVAVLTRSDARLARAIELDALARVIANTALCIDKRATETAVTAGNECFANRGCTAEEVSAGLEVPRPSTRFAQLVRLGASRRSTAPRRPRRRCDAKSAAGCFGGARRRRLLPG